MTGNRRSGAPQRPILFATPVPWNALRQRHQALAEGLVRAGYRVAYLDPLLTGGFGLTETRAEILDGSAEDAPSWAHQPASPSRGGGQGGRTNALTVLHVRVPFRASAWPGLQGIAVRLAGVLLQRAGFLTPQHLLWVADPSLASLANRPLSEPRAGRVPETRTAGSRRGGDPRNTPRGPSRRGGALVYDRCDRHGTFPGQRPGPWRAYEQLLFDRAGLILATCDNLLPAATATKARRLVVPNAADRNLLRFPAAPREPPPPLRVVSAGAHFEWADLDWLEALAALPGLELHLAGPGRGEAFRHLAQRPGVIAHGVLEHAALRQVMDRCHVGVVAFRDLPLTRSVDPVKVYEYAARGLRVWGTDLPSLRAHPFVDRCLPLAALGPDLVAANAATWRGGPATPPPPTWDDRLATILPLLAELAP